ncbi:McrC family protein [Acetanaerobacterium elongatum]|uniref:5-methylcytosine-specific restriction enzyme subunit McrC n=1 Tax=Acetanaerobacterium elongatum TaxID=258515 RepID=A0A1G9YLN5_9FIRM|nr:McrC family protein [Acetanaerobacterium elongatum]SDN10098.1 5-methylcytosine-specific restriction enzyme subunit McrC [Acetanaerobacterium elongatum]
MRSCNKTYTITEYGGFTRGTASYGYKALPEKTFDALEAFILANNTNTETEAVELLSLSARRGVGKIITAKNYVGLITMTDGTVIEILPKIVGGDITEGDTRRIFLDMLKALKDVAFKDFNVSHLHTDRLSLLEIFIKMFLDEVTILTKQGIKAAYTPIEANERFYKGKLLASRNIKYNLVNKERFFVCYDDFNINRPENRLIKSTLLFLRNTSHDVRNRQNATRLLTFFDGVEYSVSYDSDFTKCFVDRSMHHYDKALTWCRVFLKGNSFTAFAGSEVALALLFPMEKVFESFVAAKFRKHIGSGAILRTQDARYSLFDSPARAFSLRPDIVLEFDGRTVVLDTKWKLLSDNARNSGISQADMYQMYAYGKKYEADRIVLLYPYSDAVRKTDIRYASDDNVKVDVNFVDLKNVDGSISKLLVEVC